MYNWVATWDFQQCGMCDQQSLRSACAYEQSDQSLCLSLDYFLSAKLLTQHPLGFIRLKRGCKGSSEFIHLKIPHCWKSYVVAHIGPCIQAEAWSRVHLLWSLKFVLDRKSLQTMYLTFIRPILKYADVVWDNCTQKQMNDLEKIQIEVRQIVSCAIKLN